MWAYSKATKEDRNNNPRFKWICLNISWYERHGEVFPSGYYEQRVTCDDPNCCVKRIPDNQTKRLTIETPKVSVERPGHYADSQEMTRYKENEEHVQCAVDMMNSSGLLEKSINSSTFWEKDYFTPSKHISECFTIQDLEGNLEDKFQKFSQVFPTETGPIVDALRKGRRSANKAQVDVQWFPDNQTPIEEYFSKSVTTLSRCLEVICRCRV